MFDSTTVRLPFYTTSSPQNLLSSHCCASSVLYIPTGTLRLPCSFCLFPDSTRCPHPCFFTLYFLTSFSSYSLFNPHNKPFLLYFLLLLFISYTGLLLPCPCQSLCEFYANHCARIEALRRQLQEEQRGRQVEHTATAGLGWYCSWDILCNIK